MKRMAASTETTLATKAGPEVFEAVRQVAPNARFYQLAGLIVIGEPPPVAADGYILVVTAGTGDMPVAEEAAVTAENMGEFFMIRSALQASRRSAAPSLTKAPPVIRSPRLVPPPIPDRQPGV